VTADAGGAVAPLRRRRAGGTGRRWRGARGDAARPEPAPTPHERMPSRHWPGARRPLNEGMLSTAAPSYRHHPPGTSRPRAKKTRIGDFSKKDRFFAVNPSSQTPEVTRGCDLRGAESRGRSTCYASYVDEPVMMVSGVGTKHYFHQNHLYSVAAMTSSTGAVVERYRYDAYGKRTVTNAAGTPIAASTIGQQRGFTGYYLDAETGLYYARARMYSAGLGRFVSRDPLGYIDGKSLYRAYFSPNFLDPTGQAECPPPFALNTSCSKWECWLYLHSVEPGFELAQVFSGGYSIDVVTGVATPMTYTVQIPVALHECHYSCPNGTGYVHRFTEPNPPNGGSA